MVTLEEMKSYLRVDYGDDDALIEGMITAAYLYEHREEADHHALNLTLRALLFGSRKEGF